MESQRLGERQGFPHVTGEPLTDRVMPALDRSPRARFLVHGAVGRPGEDGSIGRPEVAIASTTSIGFRDGLPKPPTGGFPSVPHDAGHDRPRPSGPSAPRNSQDVPSLGRPQGPGYLRRREAASGLPPWRPHAASAVPPGDPLPIGPPNLLLQRLGGPPFGFQDPYPRPCRGTAGSRTDSVRSRLGGTGKSESPESWHPSEGGCPLVYAWQDTGTATCRPPFRRWAARPPDGATATK